MARKVFISVLGTGFYHCCKYVREIFKSGDTRFIQTATLDYIGAKEWSSDSTAIILLTDLARELNWSKGITERINPQTKQSESYYGLEEEIINKKYPLKVKDVPIPDGKDEKEMWQIFDTLFSELNDDDELYFDLTHSFRYLPMLVLILGNYAKFLKHVNIKSISYGNYEARNKNTNEAPIVDLLPLVQLQDWTFAAGQYLESGNAKQLVDLGNQELKPILRESRGMNEEARKLRDFVGMLDKVVDERQTCRGMSIIKSDNLAKLKAIASATKDCIIVPFAPIIEKIKKSLVFFDEEENARNCYAAAKWCFDNGLYQQSATILQEFVVTFFCMRHGIEINDEKKREIINQAFILKYNHQEEEKENNWHRIKEENKWILRRVLSDDLFDSIELVEQFNNLTEVRNDFNHSGMRSLRLPLKPDSIRSNIDKCLSAFGKILFNIDEND